MNFRFLGWVTLVALAVMVLPYVLRMVNKWAFKNECKGLSKAVKILRQIHKPLGIALVVVAAVHGYGMLGRLRLHSGSLTLMSIIVTGVLGAIFWKKKDKRALQGHRVMALVSVLFLLLHLFWPAALYSLFGL